MTGPPAVSDPRREQARGSEALPAKPPALSLPRPLHPQRCAGCALLNIAGECRAAVQSAMQRADPHPLRQCQSGRALPSRAAPQGAVRPVEIGRSASPPSWARKQYGTSAASAVDRVEGRVWPSAAEPAASASQLPAPPQPNSSSGNLHPSSLNDGATRKTTDPTPSRPAGKPLLEALTGLDSLDMDEKLAARLRRRGGAGRGGAGRAGWLATSRLFPKNCSAELRIPTATRLIAFRGRGRTASPSLCSSPSRGSRQTL